MSKAVKFSEVELLFVNSSNISGISYKPDDEVMFVKYKSGTVYAYVNVDKKTYEDLINVANMNESVGKFISSRVKNNHTCILIGDNH